MSCNKLLTLCVFAALGFAAPAMATPSDVFTLDTWVGSGGPITGGNYGTVTLTPDAVQGVDVSVSLNTPCCGFVSTGAGDALRFDLSGVSSITLAAGSLTSGFALASATAGSYSNGGTGSFNFAIDCTACGNGGSGVITTPPLLDFTITNVSLANFVANGAGQYFASDICRDVNTSNDHCVSGGNTGNVTAETFVDPPGTVPEPLTLSIFGAGLAGVVTLRRRKKIAA